MQKKKWSIIESTLNTLSGAVLGFCVFQFILAPLLGIPVTYGENVIITAGMTCVSIIRGYLWRRLFNWYHHRQWSKKFGRYTPTEVALYERNLRKQLERRK